MSDKEQLKDAGKWVALIAGVMLISHLSFSQTRNEQLTQEEKALDQKVFDTEIASAYQCGKLHATIEMANLMAKARGTKPVVVTDKECDRVRDAATKTIERAKDRYKHTY